MIKTNDKRIVVTGLGVVTSIGIGKESFWENLIKGKSGISGVESFSTKDQFTHIGGEVKNFKAVEFIDKKKIKLMARTSHLAIAAAKLALKDANLTVAELKDTRASVCLGTTGEIGRAHV